jgi:hypothetical protein
MADGGSRHGHFLIGLFDRILAFNSLAQYLAAT